MLSTSEAVPSFVEAMKKTRWIPRLYAALMALVACGGDSSAGSGSVDVTLRDFAIEPSVARIEPGFVAWNAVNVSDDRTHEFVIVRTDLPGDDLPTKNNGAVDIAADGLTFVGQILDLAAGDTRTAHYEVSAGAYVLFCSVVGPDVGAHYGQGMYVAFTVG